MTERTERTERICQGVEIIENEQGVWAVQNGTAVHFEKEITFEQVVHTYADAVHRGTQRNWGQDPMKYVKGAADETSVSNV